MNIYVGNLPIDVNEEELKKEFIPFGQVASVYIMNDKYIGSGQTRSYGYVVMPSHDQAATAIQGMQGKMLRNRLLQVVEALPLSSAGRNEEFGRKDSRYSKKPRQRQAL
jgi:RNA recognition motif-containing protein